MKATEDVIACVVDHGLFVPLAHKLSNGFKKVYYHTPWEESFPTLKKMIVGDGYKSFERCDSFWSYIDEIDLFVFPDIQHGPLQEYLESIGKAVWGSRTADTLEIDREFFISSLRSVGLEEPTYEVIKGMSNLMSYLKGKTDKYLKISMYRGDMETWHWRSWEQDELRLHQLACCFGAAKEEVWFLVFDPIDTDIEIGLDTYVIDGMIPDQVIQGYEWKDQAYIGAVQDYKDAPDPIQEVTSKFLPILESFRYRNFFSEELRVKGDKVFFIDPCCRFPCPASGAEMMLYSNLPEIVYRGALGELVQPVMAAKFAVECVMSAKGGDKGWNVVDFPEELRDNIMCGGSCEIDGKIAFPPDEHHGCEIGWLDALGDTIEEAIANVVDLAKQLPDGVTANTDALIDILKEIQSAEEQGMEFTDQNVPEPTIVMDYD